MSVNQHETLAVKVLNRSEGET